MIDNIQALISILINFSIDNDTITHSFSIQCDNGSTFSVHKHIKCSICFNLNYSNGSYLRLFIYYLYKSVSMSLTRMVHICDCLFIIYTKVFLCHLLDWNITPVKFSD